MSGHRLPFDLLGSAMNDVLDIADPGDAGAITVDRNFGVVKMVSAGAETRTLAAPTHAGVVCTLMCKTYVGNIVVTVASAYDQAGSTTITFNTAGDFVVLQSVPLGAAYVWRVVGFDGVTGPAIEMELAAITAESITGGDNSLEITGQAQATTVNGGAVAIAGAASIAGATGNGGPASLTGGDSGATDGTGGAASVTGGGGTGTGDGGVAGLYAGDGGGGGTGDGGAVEIEGGGSTATDGAGGAITAVAGEGAGTGNGGAASLIGGVAGATGDGGAIAVTGGASLVGATGTGGAVVMAGGANANTTDGAGGLISATGGAGKGSGDGGAASLVGGAAAGSGTGGAINVDGGASGSGTTGSITIGTTSAEAVTVGRAGKAVVIAGIATMAANDMPTTAGAGITGGADNFASCVEKIGSLFKTTIVIDIDGLNSGANADDIVGHADQANCSLGQLTTARNGTIFAGEMTCIEAPTGGDEDIDLWEGDVATGTEDVDIETAMTTEDKLIDSGGDWTAGRVVPLTGAPTANYHLYLCASTGDVNDTYTAGIFKIELWGK